MTHNTLPHSKEIIKSKSSQVAIRGFLSPSTLSTTSNSNSYSSQWTPHPLTTSHHPLPFIHHLLPSPLSLSIWNSSKKWLHQLSSSLVNYNVRPSSFIPHLFISYSPVLIWYQTLLDSFSYYVELSKHPVDGFSAGLINDDDIYEWEITIFGYVIELFLSFFFFSCLVWFGSVSWKMTKVNPNDGNEGIRSLALSHRRMRSWRLERMRSFMVKGALSTLHGSCLAKISSGRWRDGFHLRALRRIKEVVHSFWKVHRLLFFDWYRIIQAIHDTRASDMLLLYVWLPPFRSSRSSLAKSVKVCVLFSVLLKSWMTWRVNWNWIRVVCSSTLCREKSDEH